MKEFNYDINKYIDYRKKQRDEALKYEIEGVSIGDIIEDTKKAKKLCNLSDLSENAKRMIHDIERRVDDETN